jgi:regulator of sirC expression with transglutaminase-like and TPR domain
MRRNLADDLLQAVNAPGTELARAALVIARIEFPKLDAEPYLMRLDAMGEAARTAIASHAAVTGDNTPVGAIKTINRYLFDELGFEGNREKYDDPRNSCLNDVLDRRTGIPITLSVVYLEVARRAGVAMEGVNFPRHFLIRCTDQSVHGKSGLILDPFHGGMILSEQKCRVLLQQHVGPDVSFSRSLLAPATRAEIVVRMLLNLKRLYVNMRSFPQARDVIELLVALTPSALSELRDRGLLAYHLNDVSGALRDLQTYLKLASMSELDKDERQEHEQIWEHVKTLRRRVAALN